MRIYYLAILATFFLSSCLKESIPEAMMNKKNGPKVRATFDYKVNGNPVNLIVEDARDQSPTNYTLACKKDTGKYMLSGTTIGSGRLLLYFVTDSLAIGSYTTSTNNVFQMRVLDHTFNGLRFHHFIESTGDYMRMNITSHTNGYVSGNFSGLLTPLLDGNIPYIFGPPSSTVVSEGTFTNVPVYY